MTKCITKCIPCSHKQPFHDWVAIFMDSGLRDDATIQNLQDACLKLIDAARARARGLKFTASAAKPGLAPRPESDFRGCNSISDTMARSNNWEPGIMTIHTPLGLLTMLVNSGTTRAPQPALGAGAEQRDRGWSGAAQPAVGGVPFSGLTGADRGAERCSCKSAATGARAARTVCRAVRCLVERQRYSGANV